MKKLPMAAALIACATLSAAANAKIPVLKAACPDSLEVTTKLDGPVYFNGKEAKLMVYNKDFSEATLDNITISISVDANDAVIMTYSNKTTGQNSLCKL